jgi:signal transduction histidine kinase
VSDASERAVEALVQFSRLVSGAEQSGEILPRLAEAAVENAGADAAAVVQVDAKGELELVAQKGLPASFSGWPTSNDSIDTELGSTLVAACGKRFHHAITLPLVSSGDLFGALVLLFKRKTPFDGLERRIAEGLVDLAGSTLAKNFQLAELRRSYAELRAAREAMLRTEKLRALGQMAAGVSHDLKNILNPISLHLQILKRRIARGEDAAETVSEIEQAVRRGVEQLERIRDFSRQDPETRLEPVDLGAISHEVVKLCRPRLPRSGKSIRLELAQGASPRIAARASELMSALMNLVVNAIDALGPTGGTIELSCGEADGGGWVRVADDGPGMPPEVEARAFEPFFTTKGKDGTGLGLAMVYATVQRQGGRIQLETAPGKGTRFTIWLPAM